MGQDLGDKLDEVRLLLVQHTTQSEERHKEIIRRLEIHDNFINGTDSQPGARVRLDRQEQRARLTNALSLTAVTAWIGWAVSQMGSLFTKTHGG